MILITNLTLRVDVTGIGHKTERVLWLFGIFLWCLFIGRNAFPELLIPVVIIFVMADGSPRMIVPQIFAGKLPGQGDLNTFFRLQEIPGSAGEGLSQSSGSFQLKNRR